MTYHKGMAATYANDNFETYIKDIDLKKAVLLEHPVPNNLDLVKKLDSFVHDIVKDKRKQTDIDWDNALEKIQHKTINVMGPLSRPWTTVEDAQNSKQSQVSVSLENLKEHVEKTILLLGEASNYISYQR